MKIELTVDAAQWVEAEIAAGTFLTPEDAVHYAVGEARAKLKSAVAEGSSAPSKSVRMASQTQKRSPQEAAARMLNRRPLHHLPESTTIRDLMTYGRA